MTRLSKFLLSLMVLGMLIAGGCQDARHPSDPVQVDTSDLLSSGETTSESVADNISVVSCGGQYSSGNPYPCCGNGGNCTWWTWKQARDVWGVSLPGWGNANTWASYARSAGYPVSSTPAVNTIGVSLSGATGLGHVVWITKVNSNGTVQVSEMNCNWGSGGVKYTTYYTSYFSGGFIYNKSTPTLTPGISSVSPNPMRTAVNWENQLLTIYGSNFVPGAKLLFKIVGTSYVYADRIPSYVNSGTLTYNISVGPTPYSWTVQVINPDGKASNAYGFQVISGSTPTTPEITSVSPNPFPRATNWEKRVLTVSGRNFQPGAKLEFKIKGTSYVYPDRIPTFVNSNTLTYNLSVGPTVYDWTVQVINPDGKRSSLYPFSVR